MANRLVHERSPYLLQHKDNPIDWMPWGDEAFSKAETESKPLFLSIGYSSCHWCHVMAHESFEDEQIARYLNEKFVCVKVDREERPDVDEAYMMAVQLATGRGGWPMSIFATPDRKPFFAGTYFPPGDRGQYPGFGTLIHSVAYAWEHRRVELEKSANEFAEGLRQHLTQAPPAPSVLAPTALLELVVEALHGDFDMEHGGFGGSQKFPPHTALQFMLRFSASGIGEAAWRDQAAEMALTTLTKMALGGIHDHVGGGFHRYSTDERWHLPHFEKMLYDNAQILSTLCAARRLIDAPPADLLMKGRLRERFPEVSNLFRRTGDGIVSWLSNEMLLADGTFASALDADSEGEEGKYYVWTAAEIKEVLGKRSVDFQSAFQSTAEGNFADEASGRKTGENVLHLNVDDHGRFRSELLQLRAWREHRPEPQLDHKALASWNGMAIDALSRWGAIELSVACAQRWLEAERRLEALPHMIVGGIPSGIAFLDDSAGLVTGFLSLGRATGDQGWVEEGKRLAMRMSDEFSTGLGGFTLNSERHEELFGRSTLAVDGSSPSPNAAAIAALIAAGEIDRAKKSLSAMSGWIEKVPHGTSGLALSLLQLLELEAV